MSRFTICCLVFASLGVGSLYAQSSGYPDCTTSSFQLSELFINAYEREDIDSARTVLDDWVYTCGLQEVTNRAVLLLKLRSNDVLEADYLAFQYRVLNEYRYRQSITAAGNQYAYEYNRPFFGFIPVGKRYDEFTAAAFRELDNIDDAEFRFLRNVYANDTTTVLGDLADPSFEGTVLRQLYDQDVEQTLSLGEGNINVFAGVWIPVNEASPLGAHPEFGFSLGGSRGRQHYDFVLGFRFLKSANPYLARRERGGSLEETDKFFGGFIGGTAGYSLLPPNGRNDLQLKVGIAGDGWDMLNETDTQDASSLFRFVVSGGLEYRRFVSTDRYVGLYARYHYGNYSGSWRIDFDVVPVSLGVIYGWNTNVMKAQKLKELDVKYRGY